MAEANKVPAIPGIKEILSTGLQFGHSTSRWNPRMRKYIFGVKNNIHIIDVVQSRELLQQAAEFVSEAAGRGNIIFVGSKKQAAEIVRKEAVRAGALYIDKRWPGGLFTNFKTVKKSLDRIRELEQLFQSGVEGRTKYEVSRMKVEWERLNRLYGGVKQMQEMPSAMIVIDPRFEKVAVREARKMRVPVVALADTNCDPRMVDYVIPGNDDALGAVEMISRVFADAVLAGNGGKGVTHDLTNYTQLYVKITKTEEAEEEVAGEEVQTGAMPAPAFHEPSRRTKVPAKRTAKTAAQQKGILEMAKEKAGK